MTEKQNEILRHASGADSDKPGYRNRYCTAIDNQEMLGLVSLGLMTGPHYHNTGTFGEGYGLFFVTDKGFEYLGFKERE